MASEVQVQIIFRAFGDSCKEHSQFIFMNWTKNAERPKNSTKTKQPKTLLAQFWANHCRLFFVFSSDDIVEEKWNNEPSSLKFEGSFSQNVATFDHLTVVFGCYLSDHGRMSEIVSLIVS